MKTAGYELQRFGTEALLVGAVADRWWAWVSRCREPFLMALSGGRLAAPLCRALTHRVEERFPHQGHGIVPEVHAPHRPMADRLDGIHFFWADERCVPPDHPDSNYAVALQHLLAPLGIPASRIHRVRGEADPVLAAREAEAELWRWATDSSGNLPVLDLVLLGMGEDGHVASLFPGNLDQDMAAPGAYHPVLGPKPPPQRITLTYAALAAAREAWVLVAGAGKEDAWRESLRPNGRTPLARMLQARRRTYLLTTLGI